MATRRSATSTSGPTSPAGPYWTQMHDRCTCSLHRRPARPGRILMRLRHHSGPGRPPQPRHERPARRRIFPAVVAQLDTYAAAIRARLDVDTLGVSLWLPPTLAAALAIDGRARTRLRAELDARGLEVVTLSGVPYAEGGAEARPTPAGLARLEQPGPARIHPRPGPHPGRPAARRRRPRRGHHHRPGPAGRLGHRARRRRARAARPALRRAGRGRLADRPRGPGRLPARARLRARRLRPDHRRPRPARQGPPRRLPRPGQPGLHLGGAGRGPGPARRRPASRSSGSRSPRPSRPPTRSRPPKPSAAYVRRRRTSTRSPPPTASTSTTWPRRCGDFPPGPWRVRCHVPLHSGARRPHAGRGDRAMHLMGGDLRHRYLDAATGLRRTAATIALGDRSPPGARRT